MEDIKVNIDYEKLADNIAQKLHAMPAQANVIWNAKQCADYLGFSERHFVDKVSKAISFPASIQFQITKGTRSHSRWYAAEIQTWVKKQKKTIH